MVKSGLELFILKFTEPLQRYLLVCQANSAFLSRFFCTGQQQLWRGPVNGKIWSTEWILHKANYTSFRLRGLTSFIKNAIVKQPFLKTRMVIGPKTGCSDHRLALVQLGQFCSGLDSLCINQIVFWMLFEVVMDLWSFSQTQKARFFGPKRSVKRGAMFSFRLQVYQNQKGSRREK